MTAVRPFTAACLLSGLLFTALPDALAIDSTEALRFTPAEGWSEAHREEKDGGFRVEYLPAGETRESWNERVTLHLEAGRSDVPPLNFGYQRLKVMNEGCAGKLAMAKLIRTHVSSHEGAMILGLCEDTKPEAAAVPERPRKVHLLAMVVVQGERGLYTVTKAWHADARGPADPAHSDAALSQWIAAISEIALCNKYDEDRSCQPD